MMRAFSVLTVTAVLLVSACSHKEARPDDALLTRPAQQATDGKAAASAVNAVVELSFAEGNGPLNGAFVTLDEDAPDGVHLRLQLKDADGNPTVTDRLVALCTTHAGKGERVFIPLDAAVTQDVTTAVKTAEVTFAARVGGCLRPTLRMETQARPAGSH